MPESKPVSRRNLLISSVLSAGALTVGMPRKPVTVARAAPAERMPHVLDIVTSEYHFALSATKLPTGLVTLRLRNAGKFPHQVVLAKLRRGKSVADYVNARRATDPSDRLNLRIVEYLGGANVLAPGGFQETYQKLPVGRYLTLEFLPGPQGRPTIELGMLGWFDVVRAPNHNRLPPVRGTVTGFDYGFDLPRHVDGQGVYRVVSTTHHRVGVHEFAVGRLLPGKTAADVKTWIRGRMAGQFGPPPFVPAGGSGSLSFTRSQWVKLNLPPGDYVGVCMVPDARTGLPHTAMGMLTPLTVSS